VVAALIEHARNPKHRAMFMLLYGTGLRISEMLNLQITDIDSTRMVLHLRDTKNRHDRIVPLPPNRPSRPCAPTGGPIVPMGPALFGGQHGAPSLTRNAVNLAIRKTARPRRTGPYGRTHGYQGVEGPPTHREGRPRGRTRGPQAETIPT